MNPNPPTSNLLDFVAALAFVGGLLFSNPALAQVVAPYATIFFAALVGTMWSLSRREIDVSPGHRKRGAIFMAKVIGAAMIVTVPLAVWIAPLVGVAQDRYLVAPIALAIGAVGELDDWRKLLIWCRDFILRWKSGTTEPPQ